MTPLLTRREADVLFGLARGLSRREIAAELWVSRHSVDTHLRRAYDRLGVSTRLEAVAVAHRLGLLGMSR